MVFKDEMMNVKVAGAPKVYDLAPLRPRIDDRSCKIAALPSVKTPSFVVMFLP